MELNTTAKAIGFKKRASDDTGKILGAVREE